MSYGPEYNLVEKPSLDYLQSIGYTVLPPEQNEAARDSLNQVILRDVFIEAIERINNVSKDTARATYQDLLSVSDNETWLRYLRGNYSRSVSGETTKKTIHLIDFLNLDRNTFTVTNQFTVKAQHIRRPDIVIFINGIPVVVLEAKRPYAYQNKTGEAFDQIKQYEQQIPRLFYSNLFNLITDGVTVLYGATGATSKAWADWKDPYPRQTSDFRNSLEKGLWCLLEPLRLLDLLAHFIVFEKREQTVIKKLCRYQQFRAVNKICDRVLTGNTKQGLIWHTQGSGKSLTMVFATLKLKTHLTIRAPALSNPNILVLTDRIDLDDQISGTFAACGLPNPTQIKTLQKLREAIHTEAIGLTLLSTIFKFDGSDTEAPNSHNWIVLIDECHRTQEKDLGAFLRATLKDAYFFGFTGTPIKKTDKDTYRNFSPVGEGYLDRYSIDDAVADGATVPIHYTSRKTEWQIDEAKLDILFDNWFANESEETIAKIKQRGITIADLVKHPQRIELIAYDIWSHFRTQAAPQGFKAQIVAIDRETIILYKRALDTILTNFLQKQGYPADQAADWAAQMSVCIYSPNQEDSKPSEDPYLNRLRQDLKRYALEGSAEKAAIAKFTGDNTEYEAQVQCGKSPPVHFAIVCNKLLTGFDAPRESTMYLDSPLKEHSLLQAIARTNRTYDEHKAFGLIIEYIGVTKKLTEALASYREADVQNALVDLDAVRAELQTAHAAMQPYFSAIPRNTGNLRQEHDTLIDQLRVQDDWFTFQTKAKTFIKLYDALSPDPAVLAYREDLKWIAGFLQLATLTFEQRPASIDREVSAKIRDMLEEHLSVTGIKTICKLHNLTDPEFWQDFILPQTAATPQDLKAAAVRKSAELRQIVQQKLDDNPLRYAAFSQLVKEVLRQFEQGQLEAIDALQRYEQITRDLQAEEQAHRTSGLNPRAYSLLTILETFKPATNRVQEAPSNSDRYKADSTLTLLEQAAQSIDMLYTSPDLPSGWHLKDQLRKELRQKVRQLVFRLGLDRWQEIPSKIDEYAEKHYIR